MARCPFSVWDSIVALRRRYTGGPFRIVHHTTEGSNYAGARATYLRTRDLPHFTVEAATIHQHLDTDGPATALANPPGGVQTNNLSAVQIELVGFAGRPKEPQALQNVARLCRWLEQVHRIPRVWPNGYPNPPLHGNDPGGHNRDAANWATKGGHYGHCHVPENSHWDPGYTEAEVHVVMALADPARDPMTVMVNGSPVADAAAYREEQVSWAWVRPVADAMGASIEGWDADSVVLTRQDKRVDVTARWTRAGQVFVPLAKLEALPGVTVAWTAARPAEVSITVAA